MRTLQALQSWVLPAGERGAFLDSLRGRLTPLECERIAGLMEAASALVEVLERKNLSIARLRDLVFGPTTESARNLCGRVPGEQQPPLRKRRGHGRRSQHGYTGARRIRVPHPELKPAQECPGCRQGKVRPQQQPARTLRLTAHPPVAAEIHELERLRCDTCGEVFTAPVPAGAGTEKYDPSVGVLVGLLRFGTGLPFHRLERLQESVGVPLPASVQWEQALRTAEALEPVEQHLLHLGAQSAVFYNDDTPMRIASVRKQIESEKDPERTGIFTTGIVCEGTGSDPVIRLLFTGRAHAGENLARVLKERAPELGTPLQMCDALDRNEPRDKDTELCHCLIHARRQFIEIRTAFPVECRRVVETFAVVYQVEAECRKEGVDVEERLRRHQARSQPVMEALRQEFTEAMDRKKVEPNSGLGDAIQYVIKRWETLTRFLTKPGAPIDNNVTERLLKSSILHRKNSMHYRTQRGAEVGDRYMTVIETCRANEANPFDYMMAVVRNREAVKLDPGGWMPWNYLDTMAQAAVSEPGMP